MTLAPTDSVNEISRVVRMARAAFDSGDTRSMSWRSRALSNLKDALLDRQGEFVEAAAADFGRPGFEAWATEIGYTIAELNYVRTRMTRWSASRRVPTPLILHPGSSRVITEPRGLVCVISTWNYPVQLLLMPMIAAISAGNAVIGKPSELSPHTNAALGALFKDLNDPAIALVQGGSAAGAELLTHRFDHILYTGNRSVARAVMHAAAEFLTPVTLELGGKSPAIVSKHADIPLAARRIAWGKFFNAGQTCVAPDYVLVEQEVHDDLVTEFEKAIKEFYGDDPQQSPDLARIVNDHHFDRLERLLDNGTIVVGGKTDSGSRYISPTVVAGVSGSDPLMTEEILGPILPVMPVGSLQDAIEFVRSRAKPLALYAFSRRKREASGVIGQVASGGVCINGTLVHVGNPNLPFGGIGESGIGQYHGKYGFDAFSQQRAVYTRGSWPDITAAYPPYTNHKRQLLRLGFALPDPRNIAAALRGRAFLPHVRPRYR